MFSELIVWYLFFGGMSGGSYLAAYAFRILAKRRNLLPGAFVRGVWRWSLAISLGSLTVGVLCLLKDMARADRILTLFTSPSPSAIAFGSFALAIFSVFVIILLILSFKIVKSRYLPVVCIIEIVTTVLAFAVIFYTGIFLNGISAVPFWASLGIPLLFMFSSCSIGLAIVVVICAALPSRQVFLTTVMKGLLAIDFVIILLEVLSCVLLAWQSGGNQAAWASFSSLISGQYAYPFWLGFIALALCVPFVLEVFAFIRPRKRIVFYLFLSAAIVVGAFSLRYCVVNAGVHLSSYLLI